jgi:hypothetical protein
MKNIPLRFSCFLILPLAAGVLTLGACRAGPGAQTQATLQALSTEIVGTATASAGSQGQSAQAVQTAAVQATAVVNAAATAQVAQATVSAQDAQATAVALAPIRAELARFEVDPEQGRLGWIHPPVELVVEGFRQYDYENQFISTVAADFVISADITWNTQFGTSGCGFVLRSDGNQNALNQYLVIMTRGSSGHVIFAAMANGEVVTGEDIYAFGLDPAFSFQNDATNQLTVVGRGKVLTIYTNGTRIGEITLGEPPVAPRLPSPPPAPADLTNRQAAAQYRQALEEYNQVVSQIQANFQARLRTFREFNTVYERGFVALVALSESGRTQCNFDDTWLYLLDSAQ